MDKEETYSFENFKEEVFNGLALATAKAVAESPGAYYNPFYLYGDDGLGKTHLLRAIENYKSSGFPSWNCIYVTGKDFQQGYVAEISRADADVERFRNTYMDADILLVDDIQDGLDPYTEREYLLIMHALIKAGKQVVVSSCMPPKAPEPEWRPDYATDSLESKAPELAALLDKGTVVNIPFPTIEMIAAHFYRYKELVSTLNQTRTGASNKNY